MYKFVSDSNHIFRSNRTLVDEKIIIDTYLSGVSVYQISKRLGVSRNVIDRIIVKNGYSIRGLNKSQKLRYKNTTKEYRKNIVKKANEAIRNKPKSFHYKSSIKQAQAKEKSLSKVGKFEFEVINNLIASGFNPIPQKAFMAYNIDITIGNIAIEIHVNSGHPHNMAYYRKRIINILKFGWNIIYIKITKAGLNEFCINQLISDINFFRGNPSIIGQYRMIRGTGELITIMQIKGNDFTVIK